MCQHGRILCSGSQDWPGDSEHLRVPTRTANGMCPNSALANAPAMGSVPLLGRSGQASGVGPVRREGHMAVFFKGAYPAHSVPAEPIQHRNRGPHSNVPCLDAISLPFLPCFRLPLFCFLVIKPRSAASGLFHEGVVSQKFQKSQKMTSC